MPAFYNQTQTIDDLVNHSVGRILDLFDLDAGILKRWNEMTDKESLKSSICRYLVRHTTLSLATCNDGRPWSTDLFYASDDSCQLYFVSSVTTRHCQHIAVNPQVSVSISGEVADWKEIKGLQLDGVACVVSKADRDGVTEMYFTKFPTLKKLHYASEILKLLRKSSFYRISPTWVRLIDNSKGFGHKDEMIF
jgi:hypothetical protein